MKLRILGCNGPFEGQGGACSSYLVEHEGTYLVLDMGNGSLAELQRTVELSQIHAVVLSHLHYDHISDLFVMKYAVDIMRSRGRKVPRQTVFLPNSPADVAALLTLGDTFDFVYISDGAIYTVGDMELAFKKVCHPVESYGVTIVAGGRKLAYSGDTNGTADLRDLAAEADLFLADGGLLEKHGGDHAPHMTIGQACAAGAVAKKTVITHLSPLYSLEDMQAELTGNSVLAAQGQVFDLEDETV